MTARILLIDNDETTHSLLAAVCAAGGYTFAHTADPVEADRLLATWQPHIVVVDLPAMGLPGLETPVGSDLPGAPILIVATAHDTPTEVRAAYAAGAEDFVRKPIDPAEFGARLKVALRARPTVPTPVNNPFRIVLNGGRLRLTLPRDRSIELTSLEARLLRRFLLTPGAPIPREELMRVGWGRDWPTDENALEASVRRLRRKIEDNPDTPRLLRTARGLGYAFHPSV